MTTRRVFLLRQLPMVIASAGLIVRAVADELVLKPIAETDPDAKKLGYHTHVESLSARDYPSYQPGQTCMSCSLFNRARGTPFGACEALNNRLVSEDGWCTAYVPAM